jgi:hypothetical protein
MFKDKRKTAILMLVIILICVMGLHSAPAEAQLTDINFGPMMSFLFPSRLPLNLWSYPSFSLGVPFSNLYALNYGYALNPVNALFSQIYNPIIQVLSLQNLLSVSDALTIPQISYALPTGGLMMPNLFGPPSLSLAAAPMRAAAQAGTWIGTWESTFIAFIILFHSGPMSMSLIENPTLNTLAGTAILEGSRFANTLFDVGGVITTPTIFELQGTIGGGGFCIVLSCILSSPTTMTGSYTITIGFGGQLVDRGVFNLTLV